LVKAGRGSKGRREVGREVVRRVSFQANFGEEKNSENNPLSSPASPAYTNRIGCVPLSFAGHL